MNENDSYKIDTNTPEGAPEAASLPFPADAIPGIAGTLIQETRAAFGVDSDIPGGLVLAASAAVIGKGLDLEIKGELTHSNLYFIITGKSGCGKSKSFATIQKPLYEIDGELAVGYSERLPGLKARKHSLEGEAKKLESAKGKPPFNDPVTRLTEIQKELAQLEIDMIPPRIIAEDATTEILGVLLQGNGEQLALMSADCGDVILNLLGKHQEGKEDESLYLRGYTGEECRVDRITRAPVCLKSPRLTLCLVGTPDIMEKFYGNDRFMTGGFLARCLPIQSAANMSRRGGSRRAVSAETMAAWNSLLRELYGFRVSGEKCIITCTPDAEQVFDDCHNAIVAKDLAGELPLPLCPFASRVAEQAIRIAINLHALKHGANAPNVVLDVSTARDAVRLAQWFFAQQETMIAASVAKAEGDKAERLYRKIKQAGGTATMRDLKRWGWNEFEVERLIAENLDRFHKETFQPEGGGRPSARVSTAS